MASESLKTDARTLKQGIRNLNDGLAMLNVVDGAIDEQSGIVIRMRELAMQSATGTIGTTERQTVNLEFSALRNELDRIAKTTEFNGLKLLDGALASGASENIELQLGLNSNDVNRINLNRSVNIKSSSSVGLNINSMTIANKNGAVSVVEGIKNTMTQLTDIRARLGATHSRLVRAINSQLSAVENLTAAGATMKDADLASEFADLTKESILVQSSSAMIGQANLFPQGVMQLLP
jgi:flagellin